MRPMAWLRQTSYNNTVEMYLIKAHAVTFLEVTPSSVLGGLRSGSVIHLANVYRRRDLWTGGKGSCSGHGSPENGWPMPNLFDAY